MPPPDQTEQQVIPWNDTVRQSRTIRVFVGHGLRGSQWAGIADKAVGLLNDELKNKGINITIKLTKKESEAEATLDTVPGNDLHGQSLLDTQGTASIQRVTIRVPATPRVSKTDANAREAGRGVRLYIVAHELIHTLGLTNAAHSKDDVFTKNPGLLQKGLVMGGKMVAEDMVRSYDLSAVMPPIRLGAATLANLQKAWP